MSSLDIQEIISGARNAARTGDYGEAERLLNSCPDRETNPLVLNELAAIYRRQGKPQDALGALLDAIENDPARAELHNHIGTVYRQLGNLKAASMAYAKAAELEGDSVPAYNNLGIVYSEMGEAEKAFRMYRHALALAPDDPVLHFNYGVALESGGQAEDAANEYEAALHSKPGWPQPLNNLGVAYFKQGRRSEALEIFSRIIREEGSHAEALNSMAASNLERAGESGDGESAAPLETAGPVIMEAEELPKGGEDEGEPPVAGEQPVSEDEEEQPVAEGSVGAEQLPGLLRYLIDLAGALPGEEREGFLQSDTRLIIEFIIDTLEGRKGLFRDIQERFQGPALSRDGERAEPERTLETEPDSEEVAGTLAYLEGLTGSLPDPALREAMARKMRETIAKIRNLTGGHGDGNG
jgi:tetratricopeptide (TPR) repeat protein